jgi:NADH-quinone oxidoreductase subunit N
MVLGNLLATQQQSVKRMLAYSSVAHTGYALIALATLRDMSGGFSPAGASPVLFYLLTYTFMTLGAFMFLAYVGHEVSRGEGKAPEWQDAETFDDLAGLAWRRPWAAAAMTLFMVSLGGLPPTAGFIGKFYVFSAAVHQGHNLLAVIGVLASLVSWYYYLRVVVYLFMKEGEHSDEQPHAALGWVIGLSAFATIAIGLMPGSFIEAAQRSIANLN